MRHALVVDEVVLAIALLIGTGLLIKSLILLRGVNPGYNPKQTLTVVVSLPRTNYRKDYDRGALRSKSNGEFKCLARGAIGTRLPFKCFPSPSPRALGSSRVNSEIQLVELDFDELLRASFIPGCLSPLPFLEFQQFPVLWVRSL